MNLTDIIPDKALGFTEWGKKVVNKKGIKWEGSKLKSGKMRTKLGEGGVEIKDA